MLGHSEQQKTKTVIADAGDGGEGADQAGARRSRPAISPRRRATTGSRTAARSSNQRYSSLDEINDLERLAAEGRLADAPAQVGRRREVLGREPAARVPGRDLRADAARTTSSPSAPTRARSSGSTRRTSTRRSPSSAAAGRAAASRSATARSTSASSTASSSRSTRRPARSRWRRQVARWQDGYSITAAPLYVNGMRDHRRSRAASSASAAASPPSTRRPARSAWRFYTIPGPGETGHDTWPQTGNAWKHGGAPVWQTPSVDPKLGLLYFTTGNAGPGQQRQPARRQEPLRRVDGRARPEDREAASGTTRWSTTTSGTTTRRARPSSSTRRSTARRCTAIGEAEKTGWLYLLDRETGKPLFPTPEKPVPQNAHQKTWPTQPIPQLRAGRPARAVATRSTTQVVKRARRQTAKTGEPVEGDQGDGDVHAVLEDADRAHAGPAGRHELAAVELQPEHAHVLRVRAERRHRQHRDHRAAPAKQGGVAQIALGGTLTIARRLRRERRARSPRSTRRPGRSSGRSTGPRPATPGRRRPRATSSSSGATTAACRPTTRRTASCCWSFQTGAGANDAPTIFEHNGKEYVAFYAGGNALAASPARRQPLAVLARRASSSQVAAPGAGTGRRATPARRRRSRATSGKTATSGGGNAAAGQQVFASNCSTCHGATGTAATAGPNLTTIPSAKQTRRRWSSR